MRMRITIKKIGLDWTGEYNLPSGIPVIVSARSTFEDFCKYLTVIWRRDVRAMRAEGWRIA